MDAIVSTAQQSGLKILFSVQHAPAFYQRSGGGPIPSEPTTYRTFMQTMATRYAGRVQAYEIWNEENLSREMGVGNVAPTSYLPLLEAGTTGVRAADPAALMLLGAPSPTGANIPGQSIDDLTICSSSISTRAKSRRHWRRPQCDQCFPAATKTLRR